jgi:hypothetical protein
MNIAYRKVVVGSLLLLYWPLWWPLWLPSLLRNNDLFYLKTLYVNDTKPQGNYTEKFIKYSSEQMPVSFSVYFFKQFTEESLINSFTSSYFTLANGKRGRVPLPD